ncbi:6766_t:CDS:1, partial [Dentiscutata erythropus]
NKQLASAFRQYQEIIWNHYFNYPSQKEVTTNLVISSVKQTQYSVPICTIGLTNTNTQLAIQNKYWPSIENIAYMVLFTLITIALANTHLKISTNLLTLNKLNNKLTDTAPTTYEQLIRQLLGKLLL